MNNADDSAVLECGQLNVYGTLCLHRRSAIAQRPTIATHSFDSVTTGLIPSKQVAQTRLLRVLDMGGLEKLGRDSGRMRVPVTQNEGPMTISLHTSHTTPKPLDYADELLHHQRGLDVGRSFISLGYAETIPGYRQGYCRSHISVREPGLHYLVLS